MPYGYLVTVVLMFLGTWLALRPWRRPRSLAILSWAVAMVISELPVVVLLFLAASTMLAFAQGDISSPAAWALVGFAAVTAAGLVVVAWQGVQASHVSAGALREGLGPLAAVPSSRFPSAHALFAPFLIGSVKVKRIRNIRYGDAGKHHTLDVYRHRTKPATGPALLYFHGGGYFSGGKSREARSLLYRLASQGWLCISANYRLRPEAGFPDHLIDAKKVIAWYRTHGHRFGGQTSQVFVAGSSAGGQLAAIAALTPNDPVFQPGFEDVDTTVTAAICLYGYYGPYYGHNDATRGPVADLDAYLKESCPPFFIAHGTNDTYVPVEIARHFAHGLAAVSHNPVVYAELPGAQHSLDRFHSIRFLAVVDAVEAFTTWVISAGRKHSRHIDE